MEEQLFREATEEELAEARNVRGMYVVPVTLRYKEGYEIWKTHSMHYGSIGPWHPDTAEKLRKLAFGAGVRAALGLPEPKVKT